MQLLQNWTPLHPQQLLRPQRTKSPPLATYLTSLIYGSVNDHLHTQQLLRHTSSYGDKLNCDFKTHSLPQLPTQDAFPFYPCTTQSLHLFTSLTTPLYLAPLITSLPAPVFCMHAHPVTQMIQYQHSMISHNSFPNKIGLVYIWISLLNSILRNEGVLISLHHNNTASVNNQNYWEKWCRTTCDLQKKQSRTKLKHQWLWKTDFNERKIYRTLYEIDTNKTRIKSK